MVLTQTDADHIDQIVDTRLEEKFQKYSSQIMDGISEVMKELKDLREEIIVLSEHSSKHEDRISDLESTVESFKQS